MPGGVSSPVRAFRAVGGSPVYYRSGAGSSFTDADGNTYLDFVLSWGPLIVGHAHADVVRAVQAAVARGLSFGAPCEDETRLAERVVALYAGCEMVRFVSSGTEAVMAASSLRRSSSRPPPTPGSCCSAPSCSGGSRPAAASTAPC
jgi:glutamate-1-semialdehyde 2,1-aminomutase